MESLVAANSPESIDVDVLVLVNLPNQSVPHANALGRMAAGETGTREPLCCGSQCQATAEPLSAPHHRRTVAALAACPGRGPGRVAGRGTAQDRDSGIARQYLRGQEHQHGYHE